MVTTALGIAAAVWGVAMALSPILQIRKILATRSSRDVSLGYFALLLPGFALCIAYGAALNNAFLAVPNAVALSATIVTIAVAHKYRE